MFLDLLVYGSMIAAMAYVLMNACNVYDQSASFIGRNMAAGMKGALVLAIGSSLPETFSAFIYLFTYGPSEFDSAIAVTAGSAAFNMVIIPAVVGLGMIWQRHKQGGDWRTFNITIDHDVLKRDIGFLIVCEIILIAVYATGMITWWHGMIMLSAYAAYATVVVFDSKNADNSEEESYEYEEITSNGDSFFSAIIKTDFNRILFGNKEVDTFSAWVNLILSVSVIGVACHFLVDAAVNISNVLSMPQWLGALVFVAAGTSVPDTMLSVKDAVKNGHGVDGIANAIGSNIFDVTVSIAAAIVAYTIVNGPIPVDNSDSSTTALRIGLIVITALVGLLLWARKFDWKSTATLFGIFGIWVAFLALIQ